MADDFRSLAEAARASLERGEPLPAAPAQQATVVTNGTPAATTNAVQLQRDSTPMVELERPPSPTPVTAAATAQSYTRLNAALDLGRSLLHMPVRYNAPPEELNATPALTFDARNTRLDAEGKTIELDRDDTIDKADYWFAAQQRGPEAQLQVLQKFYPERNPRMIEDGTIVMQLTDEKTGGIKDVPINPEGIDGHDLLDLYAQAPEIAVGIAAAVATRGSGFQKKVGQMLASSVAANYTGQTRDILARVSAGIPLNPQEISRARNTDMYLDLFLSGGETLGAKALQVLSPFASKGPPLAKSMEFDLNRGQEFLKREFGLEFPSTPAERTGSTALRAVEMAEGMQPGARSVLGKIREKGKETIRAVQRIALGKAAPVEEIGESAIGQLRPQVQAIEDALRTVRERAEATGQTRILKMLDDITLPAGARVSPSVAGEQTLAAFETRRAAAKQLVDEAYVKVREVPGGAGDVLSGDAAANAAREIRAELPSVLKEVEGESALVDNLGRPIKTVETQRQVLKSGAPDNLLKALSDLESLQGTKVSLQTLDKMKTAAYDEIARTEAVPGVKERWFGKIAQAYEAAIQSSIDEASNVELKTALTNARDTYKKEMLPFDRPGVKELARSEFDAGRLSPEQITNRMFEGPKAIENYNMLKETLGANNPVFKTLKRAFVDTKLAEVTDPVMKTMDAKALGDTINAMHSQHPELAVEIFGNKVEELQHALRSQSALRRIDKIDESEMKVLLGLKNPGRAELADVIRMTDMRNKSYVNSILRDVADGLPVSSRIRPTEFVKRILDTNTPTKEVETILNALDEPTRDAIATATLYDLFDRSSIKNASTAARSFRGEPLDLSAAALAENLGRGGSPERLRNELLLGKGSVVPPRLDGTPGPTRLDVIENIINVQAPRETSTDAFRAAGQISGGTEVLRATREPIKYSSNYAKKIFYAMAYTSEWGTKLVSNQVFTSAKTAALANTLIASEPFVTRLIDTVGPESAAKLIDEWKASIDQFVTDITRDSPENRQRRELEKVERGEPAAVKIESGSFRELAERARQQGN